MRTGAQTLLFESRPVILSHAAIGGKKEGEGPLASYFDFIGKDNKFSQKTFEKAESKLQELALDTAKRKLGVSYEDIASALRLRHAARPFPFWGCTAPAPRWQNRF